MVRTALPVVLLGVLALSTTHQSTALDPARVATEVSYSRDIKPFFQKYCLECHNSSTAKAKVNVESVSTMTTGGDKKRRRSVVAGDADHSMVMQTLEGRAKKMPPSKYGKEPTEEEIRKLRVWIEAGAREDGK